MLVLTTMRTHKKPSCRFLVYLEEGDIFDSYGTAHTVIGHHQILKRQVSGPAGRIELMNWRLLCL